MQKVEKSYNKIVLAGIIFFTIFGFWLRGYKLPTILNTECWDITNAIRLHYLPLFNFSETIRFNFFKSFFMGTHGVADALYYYVVTGIYDLLGIPISEHYIYLAQAVLGMFFVLFLAFFAFRMFGRNLSIALFIMIFGALNLDHIMVSRTHWYCNSIKLLEFFTYATVFIRISARKKIFWDILLGGLMFLNAITPNMVIVPLVLLLQYLLYVEKKGTFRLYSIGGFTKSLLSLREFMVWIPYLCGLIIDYFAQKTIGLSGLGLFGQITHHYGFNPSVNIIKGLLNIKNQFTQKPDYFYNIIWVFSVFGGILCLLSRKLNNFGKRYLFFILLFLYHFGIEVFFGRFWLYDIFIPIIVLGGVGLYYTFKTLKDISINNKLAKVVYCALYTLIFAFIFIISADRINLAYKRDKGLNLIPYIPSFNETGFDTLYSRINPLKTVGYYLRKKTSRDDKIYILFGGDAWIGNAEYYFGKKAMGTEGGFNKQIFNSSYPLEFYKKRDGVDVFDFYIVIESFGYNDYYRNILIEAQKKGVKKIADITYGQKIYASIYSPKNLPYEILRMEDYDRKWDKEYANLKNIYENKLVGLVSLWGNY